MVDHKVDDHMDAALLSLCHHILEVIHRAILRVDGEVIHHIVAVVGGRGVDRHQPDAGHTQVGVRLRVAVVQVIQLFCDPIEVTDPIAVAVVETANEDLIEDRIVPPHLALLILPGWGRAGQNLAGGEDQREKDQDKKEFGHSHGSPLFNCIEIGVGRLRL